MSSGGVVTADSGVRADSVSASGETAVPVQRVTGADESYLMAEDLFGLTGPIQFLWVFGVDPGESAIEGLCAALGCGVLSRAVHRTRVPAARHRWVRSDTVITPTVTDPIDRDDIGRWADRRLRQHRLSPTTGLGWQLDSAATGDGGRVVSLLVSHMIADGQGVYRALAAASVGQVSTLGGVPSRLREIGEDLRDCATAVRAAGRSARFLARHAWVHRHDKTAGDGESSGMVGSSGSAKSSGPTSSDDPVGSVAEPTLAIVDIDRDQWQQRAAELGGTANSLFTAVLAGVVSRSGLPKASTVRVCMAVSQRGGDDDVRANASGGVWIRVPSPVVAGASLSEIRSLSKTAFTEYAESGAEQVADNMAPVVRLLPKAVIAKAMNSLRGPDTTVSNLGIVPESALRIGDQRAERFAIRAIAGGMEPAHRLRGPAVAAWSVEYENRITLTFFGIHPDHFGDSQEVRTLIGSELDAWKLGYRFW